ncbi:MAG: NAD(P)H-binding protein [Solirubrobacterales bacterium]
MLVERGDEVVSVIRDPDQEQDITDLGAEPAICDLEQELIEAAKQLEDTRYVMVSSIGADADHQGDEVMDVYIRAKGRADEKLRESGLGYLIVRPGALTDEQGTGRVKLGEDLDRAEIPREDAAAVLAEALRA